ncbi:hypothetical protein TEA_016892 [Camellia sinensis var. sinensis]|uniref:Cathepsin propeptide inhibitor domain-containing protein n=1 Tax=Camellia sinensis var. sinensis TaxID=542762 RepID=A0A4S4E7C8_CAMSN|nr:hypothetical protein TEA_016892 [Camellia sinensis var. sinensis]
MSRTLPGASMSERHEQWMADHGRVYKDNAEKDMRFKIFNNNVLFIESFNNAGNQPYKLSINQFADLTNEEFQASHNGYRIPSHARPSKMTPFRYENVTAVPANMDWRKKGAATPIRIRVNVVRSCRAFSTIAATEGITQLTTGKLISLSEQELVDCDRSGKDAGSTDGTCNTKKEASHPAKISGYENVPANRFSQEIVGLIWTMVSLQLDMGQPLMAPIKNSWGTSWGEEGYIRMQRDIAAKEGLCGIAMDSSNPTA